MMLRRVSPSVAKNLVAATSGNKSFIALTTSAAAAQSQPPHQMREYTARKKTVAIVSTGCGFLDGSEITETVSLMIHLSEQGYTPVFFAPEGDVEQVYDHTTKNLEKNEIRNMMGEVARIARAKVFPLKTLKAKAQEALVIPGGGGVNTMLSNYAEDPKGFAVEPVTAAVIKEFFDESKPILLTSNAVVLAAAVLGKRNGGPGVKLCTAGDQQLEDTIKEFGCEGVDVRSNRSVVDAKNKVVSSPGFAGRSPAPHEVHQGMGAAVSDFSQIIRGVKQIDIDWEFHDFYVTKARGRSQQEWDIIKKELKVMLSKEQEKKTQND